MNSAAIMLLLSVLWLLPPFMRAMLVLSSIGYSGSVGLAQTRQAATVTAVTLPGETLGTIAAANNATAEKLISNGQLVCAVGSSFVAIIGANVTGAREAAMQTICAGLGGVGSALPRGPSPEGMSVATLTQAKAPRQAAEKQAGTVTAVTLPNETLGTVADANNTTSEKLISNGQLVCTVGSSFVAIIGANVTGARDDAMKTICAGLGGVGSAFPRGVSSEAMSVATLTPAKAP